MARYVTQMHRSLLASETFAYLADVERFVEREPGIVRSTRVNRDAPGPGASFDIEVKNGPRTMTFRYETAEWDPPQRLILRAETRLLLSSTRSGSEPGTRDRW